MKIPVLFIWISFIPIFSYAEQNSGAIDQLQPGVYQLLYPNQTIDIYFNFLPTNGFENVFIENNLSETEKYEIVNILKEQIDELPASFIEDYMDIDIFPLYIKNGTEFGYVFDRQIVIEASKIKYNMSFKNSIKSSFVHEIGHLIEDDLNSRKATNELKSFLDDTQANQEDYKNRDQFGNNVYKSGFVSRYASGDISEYYSSSEEFAELFAHLVCKENRSDLIDYIEENPESLLTVKTNRLLDLLDYNFPEIGRGYIFYEKDEIINDPVEIVEDLDGVSLLNSHAYKSYEDIDFDAFGDDADDFLEDQIAEINKHYESKETWSDSSDEIEYTVYPNSSNTEAFAQNDPEKTKKSKKKKRRKGRGLLIAGTAIYIALQLIK